VRPRNWGEVRRLGHHGPVRSPDGFIDAVASAVREVADEVVEPRHRALTDAEISEKAPGEVVTAADHEAEVLLGSRLQALAPGVPVVGEEAVAADPTTLDALGRPGRVWLVDPVDGTANFVRGSDDYAVMVSLVDGGVPLAAWIWRPADRVMFVAERGSGAYCNGERMASGTGPPSAAEMRGAVLTWFLPSATASTVARNRDRFGSVGPGRRCAGVDHPLVASGDQDFVVFWRTLPWDHAPGVLLVEEAGGVARRPDGTPYRPGPVGEGLVAARDEATWETVVRELLGH
jgi:fructose-1,6-bisphosphatase/inositol monophosphatase family enzyme